MSRKRTIYNALPIVAAAYAEQFGVKIVIGTHEAYTDGETIVIPNVPSDYPNMDVVWGYLAHEAAHVRFTDFSVERRRGLHAELSNIFEDCRIERAMMEVYPGTEQTLNEVAVYMAHAGHYQHADQDTHPAAIVQAFCLYWLQCRIVGQSVLEPFVNSAERALHGVFPQGVVTRLNAILRTAVGAQSTADAVALADDVLKMLEEEKNREEGNQPKSGETPSPPSNGDGSSGSNDGSEQTSSDPGGDGSPGKSHEPQGSDESGNKMGDQGGNQGSSDTSKGAADVISQALSAGAGDMLDNAHDSLKRELLEVAQKEGDPNFQAVREASTVPRSPSGRQLLDSIKSTTSKIRSQLYGLVQASQRSGNRNRRSGKRLDTRNLCRVVSGDTRIFRSPTERRRPNTAVHILVDMSSSMNAASSSGKESFRVAREAALAVSLALDAIPGVNPAVTYFRGCASGPLFSVVKHGQSVVKQSERFMLGASGGTPMAEAIWYAAYELSKTKEERKMIIVVTDGEPHNVAACNSVIELCSQSGFEMVGIGIKSTAVKALFHENIVIDDVDDLQRTLFQLLQKSLMPVAA